MTKLLHKPLSQTASNIKARRRATYLNLRLFEWKRGGSIKHKIPKIRILDDEAAKVLMSHGIDPLEYYKRIKNLFGFHCEYALEYHKKEEEKRKEHELTQREISREVAMIDLQMKIDEGLICPSCLKPLEGFKFHPECNATRKFHPVEKSTKTKTRRSVKVKTKRRIR